MYVHNVHERYLQVSNYVSLVLFGEFHMFVWGRSFKVGVVVERVQVLN